MYRGNPIGNVFFEILTIVYFVKAIRTAGVVINICRNGWPLNHTESVRYGRDALRYHQYIAAEKPSHKRQIIKTKLRGNPPELFVS